MVYYGEREEDMEVTTMDSFFGTAVTTASTAAMMEKEYTDRGKIEELLGCIYPSYLSGWLYVPDILEESISVHIQEADNREAWYYNWNDSFVMRKNEVPEFVREDTGG